MFLSGPQFLAQIEAYLTQRLGQESLSGVPLMSVEKLKAHIINSKALGSMTISVCKNSLS